MGGWYFRNRWFVEAIVTRPGLAQYLKLYINISYFWNVFATCQSKGPSKLPGTFAEILAHKCAGIFLAENQLGRLEFAVPGFDVRTVDQERAAANTAAQQIQFAWKIIY